MFSSFAYVKSHRISQLLGGTKPLLKEGALGSVFALGSSSSMRRVAVAGVGLFVCVACSQQGEQRQSINSPELESGINLQNFDKSVRPQDDFYRHVNGTWLKQFELPADKSNYGAFTILDEQSRGQVKAIVNDVANKDNTPGSAEQKIADVYNSFMDVDKIEERGLNAIADELEKISKIADRSDLSRYLSYADIYTSAPFGMYVYIDKKKADEHIVYFSQHGLGLPDRDYYFKQDDKSKAIRQKYQAHIGNMLGAAGFDAASEKAQRVMAMETDLAEHQWNRVQNRDSEKTYNRYSIRKFTQLMPSIDWTAWFSESMIDIPNELIVRQPSYFENLNAVLRKYTIANWQDYLRWHLLSSTAPYLNKTFAEERFAFYGTVLSGTTEQEPRWKRAVNFVNDTVGELVGQVYVERHFPAEAKARMQTLIENLRDAYGDSIRELDWMSEGTKEKALAKLASFDPKVGYPDVWKDYSKLDIAGLDLVANAKESTRFEVQRNRSKLGQPIDRNEWSMTPQTVNAYYNPLKNEIVFPAAILQAPFFNLLADEAVNYGAIGAVIGHEMGHGFDDQGSKYDGDGNLRNWWTEEDRERFEARTRKLIAQFDAYTVVDGTPIKGNFTQGENIGDLSGVSIAYKAFKENYPNDVIIDGYTPDQRFFLGWAQVWMRKYRDQELLKRVETDPHSPSEYRCNGILKNIPEFYQAFNVKPGDGMYLPPDQRVKIW